MRGWAQLLEDEDLSHPTSITAKQFRTDFLPPVLPFFLGDSQSDGSHPLHQTSPEKTQKCTRYTLYDGR